jgi:hypothetical protein
MFFSKTVQIHARVLFAVSILQGWKTFIGHINLATRVKPFSYCAIQVGLVTTVAL